MTQETIRAYDADAAAYASMSNESIPASVRRDIEQLAADLPPGALVLEIGSGGGRDAALMEGLGLRVRRTDVTAGFVQLLVAAGHEAEVLDPLTDELGGPHDAVWANACLLHVDRADLPTVLRRLAGATVPGGLLRFSVKEGDGEGWSTHGSISSPRHFTYWREDELRSVVEAAWNDVMIERQTGTKLQEQWLEVTAVRR